MVEVGLATGLEHVVQLNPVDGLHEKFPAPVPLSVVEFPIQIEASAPVLTEGSGKIFTITWSVSVQLFCDTIKVYVVVAVGLATGFEIFGLLKLPEGDQL